MKEASMHLGRVAPACLAVLLLIGASAARVSAAVDELEAEGVGTSTTNSVTSVTTGTWTIVSPHVGKGTFTASLKQGTVVGNNGSGGSCALESGSGTMTAANGDKIQMLLVGLGCNVAGTGTPVNFNLTYFISDHGTGRFAVSDGTGNVVFDSDCSPSKLHIFGSLDY